MNTMYVTLLADPGKECIDTPVDMSSLLGSFDAEQKELFDLNSYETLFARCHATLATLELAHNDNKTFLDDQFCQFTGLESLEVTEMIKRIIKSIFQTIYRFLAGTINFVKSMFKRVISIDTRLNDNADAKFKELERTHRQSSPEITSQVEEILKNKTVSQMCSKDTFVRLIEDFHVVMDPIDRFIKTDLNSLIDNMGRHSTATLLSTDTFSGDGMVSKLDSLGVALKNNKATYKSPFAEFPATALKDLHFSSVQDIIDLSKAYTSRVWTTSGIWNQLIRTLETFKTKVEMKEKELLHSASVEKTILTENAKIIQKEITFILNVVTALRQFKTSLNFRRRELCVLGLNAYNSVKSKQ